MPLDEGFWAGAVFLKDLSSLQKTPFPENPGIHSQTPFSSFRTALSAHNKHYPFLVLVAPFLHIHTLLSGSHS